MEWVDEWSSAFGNDTLKQYTCVNSFPSDCIDLDSTNSNRTLALFWDSVAKMFYSFVMSDLGQSIDSNILGNKSSFVTFLNSTRNAVGTDALRNQNCTGQGGGSIFETSHTEDYSFNDTDPSKFYEWYGSPDPIVYPAVINTQYLCQIPKRKPIGTITVNLIIADLVFLQAIWTVFSWAAKSLLERRDPQANYCPGCAQSTMSDELGRVKSRLATPEDYEQNEEPFQFDPSLPPDNPVIHRYPATNLPRPITKRISDATVRLLSEA